MQLFFRTYGKGVPLIILHGLFGMSDNWVSLAKKFAKHYKVYIPDMRNHGKSPHSSLMNYFAMADDMKEFMEDNSIEEAYFIGHSMGGKTAMLFALENPHMVKKLVVADIAPGAYKLHHIDIIKAMKNLDFDKLNSREEIDQLLSNTIQSSKVRQLIMKNLQRIDPNRLGWKINIEAVYQNIDSITEEIQSENIFEKPTLFIKGEHSDYITPERDIPLILSLFPKTEMYVIAGASHWLHAEDPDQFFRASKRFFEDVGPLPG